MEYEQIKRIYAYCAVSLDEIPNLYAVYSNFSRTFSPPIIYILLYESESGVPLQKYINEINK